MAGKSFVINAVIEVPVHPYDKGKTLIKYLSDNLDNHPIATIFNVYSRDYCDGNPCEIILYRRDMHMFWYTKPDNSYVRFPLQSDAILNQVAQGKGGVEELKRAASQS